MVGFVDAWNVLICTFEDFTKLMLKFEVIVFENLYTYVYVCIYMYTQ